MKDKNNTESKEHLTIPEVYDIIAESFDCKRSRPWKEVMQFIEQFPSSSRILDLGCGSARHTKFMLEKNFTVIGLDISFRILQVANERRLSILRNRLTSLVNGDATNLPFKTNSFDNIIMIAVLHHFESLSDRLEILREIKRILSEGGKCLITTWSKLHPRFEKKDLCELVKSGKKDILVPWTLPNGRKISRYYYLFEKEELEELVSTVGFKIESSVDSRSNIFLTVRNC
ncbi:MAG: class I SAM-dependent methyltransferase [Asgard group archaeon]|nr:class I SAM-dependent methyltransferase [Asgard group archaeon]